MVNHWIKHIKHIDHIFTEILFNDGTIATYPNDYIYDYFIKYYHDDDGEIYEWLSDRNLSFNPKEWDQDTKVLFQLTFE